MFVRLHKKEPLVGKIWDECLRLHLKQLEGLDQFPSFTGTHEHA